MRHFVLKASLIAAALISFSTTSVRSDDGIRTVPVHFKAGASGAAVKGAIKGYEAVDYVLEAGKGQHMTVSMATDNASSYFNILAPGQNEAAMFVGSASGNQFEGTLPHSGAYKIRVYMMRNAARREEVANYQVQMAITGAAKAAPAGEDSLSYDALVEGTDYHATGTITCAMGGGQPAGSCAFGVKRKGNGSGTVIVTKPDGRKRTIFFENGNATGADTNEADPGEFAARKQNDLSIVLVGEERYEVPDAVIFGG